MTIVGIIPARLASSRLPRKLLLAETGKPLLQHTWEAASRAGCFDRLIVAVDSPELADAVQQFGGECQMTGEHNSGADRIAEVVARTCRDAAMVVNIQGDEPEIEPEQFQKLIDALAAVPAAHVATLACRIHEPAMLHDPSCVKVVCSDDMRAMYFSRATIPHLRDGDLAAALADSPWLLHIGLYAFRPDFLLELAARPQSKLERIEKLEQLRALEMGAHIQVAEVSHRAAGIDTAEDYAAFVRRVRNEL